MRMIIIASLAGDAHGIAVSHALNARGVKHVRWLGNEFPTMQYFSCSPELHEHTRISIPGRGYDESVGRDSTVWLRRVGYPILPNDGILADEDLDFARKEARTFTESWLQLLSQGYCVNPFDAKVRANSKLLQLSIASELGMNIPRTLVGNDPIAIRELLRSKPVRKWLYKPFRVHQWNSSGACHLTHAAEVTENHFPSDLVLARVPGIYQEVVERKLYEVRANFFGNFCVAAKLSNLPMGKIDWRSTAPEDLGVEPFALPDAIQRQCRALMKRLGIVFGCFDFVVDIAQKYWFLEVNESGQFLWIERANPCIPLLDVCCEFLMAASDDFQYRRNSPKVSYYDLLMQGVITRQMEEEKGAIREGRRDVHSENGIVS